MKHFHNVCLISCLSFLFACNSNNEEQAQEKKQEDDSTQTVQSIVSEDSAMIFNNAASGWINRSMQKNSLNWNRFHLEEFWSDDSLVQQSFQPEKNFYKDYTPVLRWSPDSNYILDIGSYGSVKVKNADGTTKIEGGEPDSEVSLIDAKTKTKTRLLFFGPATIVSNGGWLDSTQAAVLAMHDEKGDHHPDTLLWIINVKDKFFRKYKYKGNVDGKKDQ